MLGQPCSHSSALSNMSTKEEITLLPVMEAHLFPYAKATCSTCNGTGRVMVYPPGSRDEKDGKVRACNCAYKRFSKERDDVFLQKGRLYYKPALAAVDEVVDAQPEIDRVSPEESPADGISREVERLELLNKRKSSLEDLIRDDLERVEKRRVELIAANVKPLEEQYDKACVKERELQQKLVALQGRLDENSKTIAIRTKELADLTRATAELQQEEQLLTTIYKDVSAVAADLGVRWSAAEHEAEKIIAKFKQGDLRDKEREIDKVARRIERLQARVRPIHW